MVSLRLTSLERRGNKALARLWALEHSQPISPRKDSSRPWSLEHLLCKPRLLNNSHITEVIQLTTQLPAYRRPLDKTTLPVPGPASQVRMNTPTIGFLRIGEAEGSFVTPLRVSLPVETQNLPKDKDRIMGLHQEVECMNHLQTRVRKGEGHHPLVTEDPLQIPLMPSREVVAYRERKGQYYQVPQLACLDIWLPQYNINNLGHPARCLHRANNLRRDINFLRVILRVDPIQHTVNQADQRIDIQLQEQHRVSGQ
ncbi:uncharacterized protein FOBCDRAFT_246158 [Fusarium oxysporum Fo47]|uniref:uncharacterized protein n=1 Tax=Fusarium oxysporum Fo47 TaxID=660027 RepID=UPI002869C4F9|nr:uncharacterized protein FOBCDRAFT_246158 [Fusarium oxysporum Fo47]QKD62915.2 hypothetical protein FOBCDRAFT_246158 [Fusarium oxysporum Fo47]